MIVAGPVQVPLVAVSTPYVVPVPATVGTTVFTGPVFTFTLDAATDCSGPCVLARSTTAPDRRVSTSEPAVRGAVPDTVTAYGPNPDPLTLVTDHPAAAAPRSVKSATVSPLTNWSKLSVYVMGLAVVTAAGVVNELTVGVPESRPRNSVTVAALYCVAGPALPAASVNDPARNPSVTVPLAGSDDGFDTVTVYGPVPDPVIDCTPHPLEVPPTMKLLAVSDALGASLRLSV